MGIQKYKSGYKKGIKNTIGDVYGVRIGHTTIHQGDIHTGVTIVLPSTESIFLHKLPAAMHVINGFGKTTGLVQIDEMGVLESPIALTNTLSVGTVQQALVNYMLQQHRDIGNTTGTINVVVGECNDSYLNDIRLCYIEPQHVYDAIKSANNEVEEGSVGAGAGMSCYEMKGGIGSSSRIVTLDNKEYIIGTLVLSNFGLKSDFIGERKAEVDIEQGSCMMIIATNIPMDSRQLKRVCKRMAAPLCKTGSYLGNGSGDIALAFSTASPIPHYPSHDIMHFPVVHESCMDTIFRASIDAMQEAILSSLWHSHTTVGRNGNIRDSIHDLNK